jgi:RNA polymerase sigma factor (sigma-70 family)
MEGGALPDEAALVAKAAAGDESTFAELLASCRDQAWSVCYRICGNRHDAEDALQDAAIAAWRHLGAFRGHARFSSWFYRVAANAALQIVRKQRDIPHAELPERPHTIAPFDEVERSQLIQAALSQLRPDFRAALVLREYADLSYEEIAAWQGIPIQTVKSRLNRARTALAHLLDPDLLD